MKHTQETIIIAIGGSLLIPDAIDVDFIHHFIEMVSHLIEKKYKVIIVPGGGKTARNYQIALKKLGSIAPESLDWVGIKSIHVNCELLHHAFATKNIETNIIFKPEELSNYLSSDVIIKAAFKPGNSSDVGAIRMAEISGAVRIINFSNTTHVYSADPRTNPDAEKFDTLSWDDYRQLIPAEWTPGMSAPFDPIASKMAQDNNMTVAVLGASLENLENYLAGHVFEGTIIS